MNNICFVDFETTGIDLINDYPIEIGAVLVDVNLNVIKKFHSFIKPKSAFKMKETAFRIHGISEHLIMQSPSESMVLGEMRELLGSDFKLAAWNMSFDVAFFKALCLRNSFDNYLNSINYRHLDVQTISYVAKELQFIPYSINSLSDLLTHIGQSRSKTHNALEDAMLLVEVYKFLLSILKERSQLINN